MPVCCSIVRVYREWNINKLSALSLQRCTRWTNGNETIVIHWYLWIPLQHNCLLSIPSKRNNTQKPISNHKCPHCTRLVEISYTKREGANQDRTWIIHERKNNSPSGPLSISVRTTGLRLYLMRTIDFIFLSLFRILAHL